MLKLVRNAIETWNPAACELQRFLVSDNIERTPPPPARLTKFQSALHALVSNLPRHLPRDGNEGEKELARLLEQLVFRDVRSLWRAGCLSPRRQTRQTQ